MLVVDDDKDIRDTLIEVLIDHGHAAIGAANGNEALHQLRTFAQAPCLILLDLMMPDMDGRAFREHQLRDPLLSPIPVIVVSAFRDVGETAAELGAAGHVKKPIGLTDLLAMVEQFCPRGAAHKP